ncbi:hypothetical protein KKI24_27745 [bacterium]|nr:hypothetical protein [bacterium]
MPAKQKYDWEAIEKDYRTGQYSNYALSEIHGASDPAIRKRAKQYNWEKDLVDEYQEKIKNRLVRDDGAQCALNKELKSNSEIIEDKTIVDNAVAIGIAVIRNHRKKIRRLQDIADALADKLYKALVKDGEIDLKTDKDFEVVLAYKGNNESITDMAWKLARIEAECVKLERQAFNLDSKEKEGGGASDIDERIKARMEKLKR